MKPPGCHPIRKYFARDMCEPCYKQWWSENNRDKTRAAGIRYEKNNAEKCKQRRKIEYLQNRERKRMWHKMRNATPEGKRRTKDRHLQKRYGIGLSQYDELFAQQSGACAICGDRDGFGGKGHNLRVDHDHTINQVRGLLCNRCNTGLGYLENSTWFNKAILYLKQWKEIQRANLKLIKG